MSDGAALIAPPALAGRTIDRRRSLPGGRAVVGGFLIALAAVGTFAAYTGATADTRVAYVVARRDVPAGHLIAAADLATGRASLPAFVAARSFHRPASLVGAVAVAPIGRGELIEDTLVVRHPDGTPVGRELSFPVDAARAVDGRLQPGELVDVLATYGSGADAYTVTVVRGAEIVGVSTPKGGFAATSKQVVSLSLASPGLASPGRAAPGRAAGDDALALAHAVNAGSVTIVRAGGSGAGDAGGGASAPDPYRAPAPEPARDAHGAGA